MGAELTVRQKILVSAVLLSEEVESFSVEDLIVRSWQLYPDAFSLRGYYGKHPDSNRVLAKLSGVDGLCGLGWLEHTDQRMYRVTRKGRGVAKQLQAIASGAGVGPSLVAVNDSGAELEEAPAPRPAPVKKEEAPRAAKARKGEPKAKPEAAPARPLVELTQHEILAVNAIAKSDALRKFLRGSPLTFADACSFWGVLPARPAGAIQKLEATEELLKRVVESFGAEGAADARLPPLSTCYGLLNLHKLMLGRFAREIEALRVQLAAG